MNRSIAFAGILSMLAVSGPDPVHADPLIANATSWFAPRADSIAVRAHRALLEGRTDEAVVRAVEGLTRSEIPLGARRSLRGVLHQVADSEALIRKRHPDVFTKLADSRCVPDLSDPGSLTCGEVDGFTVRIRRGATGQRESVSIARPGAPAQLLDNESLESNLAARLGLVLHFRRQETVSRPSNAHVTGLIFRLVYGAAMPVPRDAPDQRLVAWRFERGEICYLGSVNALADSEGYTALLDAIDAMAGRIACGAPLHF